MSNKNIVTKLKTLWQKILGKDLTQDMNEIFNSEKYTKNQQMNLNKRLQNKLKIKRFFIILFIILSLTVFIHFINKFICFSKYVCIHKGEPSNYSHFYYPMYIKISDDETFIKHFPWLYEEKQDSEIYSVKGNKFKKVTDIRKLVPICIPNTSATMQSKMLNLTKNDSNEIIMIDYLQPIYKYNLKDKTYTNTYKDYISSNNYIYLSPYQNKILLMSNFNHFEYPRNKNKSTIYNYEGIGSKTLEKNENLYLLNTNTLELEKFPDFEVMPKRVPISSDILCLKDGTIIVPIRYKDKERKFATFKEKIKEQSNFYKKCDNDYIWDHIEIYNPKTNLFKAEFNTDVLKENLFNFELKNGNILFINQKDSYIFDIKTHSFIMADELTQRLCQTFIKRINDLLKEHMSLKLEEPSTKRIRYIKLNDKQYLLSCGEEGYLYKDYLNYDVLGFPIRNPIKTCHKSVIIDFEKLKAQIGPNFKYSHYESTAIPLNNNKVLFIGGADYVDSSLNTQILEIKEK